jgi:hypothetical protein
MPDPIFIVGSTFTIVLGAYNLSKTLYELIDGIVEAPKHLGLVSTDLKGLYSILGTLHHYLQDEETTPGVLYAATHEGLEGTVMNCVALFKDIRLLVFKFIRDDSRGTVSTWGMLRSQWGEKRLSKLSAQLTTSKITLNLAVATSNLYVSDFKLIDPSAV